MPKLIELRRAFFAIIALLFFVVSAAAAPACGGRDLIADMKDSAPQTYARLNAEAAETLNGEGLLWRVEKAGVAPSHLFGTIHITDPRVTELAEPVRAALDTARLVAVESVEALDRERMAQGLGAHKALMYFQDGRSLAQHVGETKSAALATALKTLGADIKAFGAMKPWVVAAALSAPACETARQSELAVVDKVIADTAQEAGVSVVSLESVAEQLAAFDAIPVDMQTDYLIATVLLYPRMEDLFATLTELYLQRRVAEIEVLSRILGEETGVSKAGEAAFNRSLVERRNMLMVERAAPLINEGAAFIAVGALHLIGETGLVQALREKGFEVTRVY